MKIFTFENNKTLREALKKQIKEHIQSSNFLMLKDSIHILTRETLTAEYLSMQLPKDEIPSLCLEIRRLRDFMSILKKEYLESKKKELLEPFYCENLFYSIITKNKDTTEKSEKNLRQLKLAKDLFNAYEETISKCHKFISKKYQEIFKKFKKEKKNYLTEMEALENLVKEDFTKSKFLKSINFPIYIFGIDNIEPLYFKILSKISKLIEINFFFCEPYLNHETLILKEIKQQTRYKRKEETLISQTQLYFYEAPEIHREVEFVARHILGKISESLDPNLHLTRIKVIIPQNPSYAIALKNSFMKMGIPFTFVNELYVKKQTAYFNAVLSLIRLINSNFEKNLALSLFQNPCFSPLLPRETNPDIKLRYKIKSDLWVSLFNQLHLSGFLDSEHRKQEGFSEEDYGTWEKFWYRAALAYQGEVVGEGLISEEIREEIPIMLDITYLLFQDLIYLREVDFTPEEFVNYFLTILEVYLDPNYVSKFEDQKNLEYYQKLQNKVYEDICSICKQLIHKDTRYGYKMYLNFLLDELLNLKEYSGRILKYGVIVGSFEDTNDIVLDYIYALGVDENQVPTKITPREYIKTLEYSKQEASKIYLYSKESFYSILNNSAKEIHLSYVNRDSIGDKPIYPSRELLTLLELSKKYNRNTEGFIHIPLFTYLEPNSKIFEHLTLEEEAIQTIWLKQLENEYQVDMLVPNWEEKNQDQKSKAEKAWQQTPWKEKLFEFYFIPKLKVLVQSLPEEINLRKFLQFLECPRKYFYTNYLRLEAEEELSEDLKTFTYLQDLDMIRNFCFSVFSTETKDYESLIQDVLSLGQFPHGLLGEVEKRKKKEFFMKLIDGLNLQNWTQIIVTPKFRGEEELGGGELFDKKVFFKTDFLFKNEQSNYLTKLVVSNNISWKTKLELYLQTQVLQKKNFKFEAMVLQIKKDTKVEWKNLDFINFSEQINEFLQKRWQKFVATGETSFEAEPFQRPKNSYDGGTCQYCRFKQACPGFNYGYESEEIFLENQACGEILKKI